MEECECFALQAKYMEQVIFPRNLEIEAELRSSCYHFYKTAIYRPLMLFRKQMIKSLNKKKKYEKVIDLRNPPVPEDFNEKRSFLVR